MGWQFYARGGRTVIAVKSLKRPVPDRPLGFEEI
jgi:hypothetical protein